MPPEDFARLVASIREDGLNCCGARLALNDKPRSGASGIYWNKTSLNRVGVRGGSHGIGS